MARARKIKEVAEEVKHEEVEGQTELNFGDVPEQTEEVEEVLTGQDFPHHPKGKGGRPLNQNKKIQMKLYMTLNNKLDCERLAHQYGLSASQLIGLLIEKINDMDLDQELTEFLGVEPVSAEKKKHLEEVQEARHKQGYKIKNTNLNLLRKHQFSQGKFSPAEILETFSYVNLNLTTNKGDKYSPTSTKLKELMLAKNFRIDEYIRVVRIINKVVDDYCKFHAVHSAETIPNLWKIEDFYCENITAVKINSKAKQMTVSADINFYNLLLEK